MRNPDFAPLHPGYARFSAVTGERLRPVIQLCAADVDLHRARRSTTSSPTASRRARSRRAGAAAAG